MLFLKADLSQAEGRVVYALTQDPELIEIARSKPWEFDMHRVMGEIVMAKPATEITSKERYAAKRIVHGCLSPEHEVLTRSGWTRIDQLPPRVEVAQWNNGLIEFVIPQEILSRPYQGVMYNWEQTGLSQITTPNHRMVYQTNGIQKTCFAEDFTTKGAHMPVGGDLKGGQTIAPAEIRLLVATQADGSFTGHKVRFHFHKKRKFDRLLSILSETQYKYTHRQVGRDLFVSIHSPQLISWFGGVREFNWKILDWDRDSLKTFVAELPYWDGSWTPSRRTFVSTNEQSIRVAQTAAHLCGQQGLVRRSVRSSRKDLYILSLNRRRFSTRQDPQELHLVGKVWCLRVPSGFFMVRHRGKISVSGNTHYDMHPTKMSEALLQGGFVFPVAWCAAGQQRYLTRFPAIQNGFQRQIRSRLLKERKLTNSWGAEIRFRYETFGPDLCRRGYAWVPQSEIGRLLNVWGLIPVYRFIKSNQLKSRINLQIHDELLISVTRNEVYDIAQELQTHVTREREYNGVSLGIPVEFGLGTTWKVEREFKQLPSRLDLDDHFVSLLKLQGVPT